MGDNIIFLNQFRRTHRTATRTFAEFRNDCFQACVVVQRLEEKEVTLAEAARLKCIIWPNALACRFFGLARCSARAGRCF
ncbi:MAG: hypothetical protein WCA56_07290 [Xanthobacteraceae bacterium]